MHNVDVMAFCVCREEFQLWNIQPLTSKPAKYIHVRGKYCIVQNLLIINSPTVLKI